MSSPLPLTARLASWTLPAGDRDIVMADLWEESAREPRRARWVALQAIRIATHHQMEYYRDPRDAVRLIALLAAGATLLLVIRAIGLGPTDGAKYFTDPVTRAILAFWSASHVTSALAAGLLIGRVALPAHLSAARVPLAAALSVLVLWLHGGAAGVVGAAILVAAATLAGRAREAALSHPPQYTQRA